MFNVPGSVNEGSSCGASFTWTGGGANPGGFTYSFDLDGDGVFESVDGASDTILISSMPDGPRTLQVSGRVKDSNGDSTLFGGTITVQNMNPAPAIAGAGGAFVEGQAVTGLSGSAGDVFGDMASMAYAWVIKNAGGTVVASGTNPSAITFTPADNGTFTVFLTATDKDGGIGNASATLNVANAAPVAAGASNAGPVVAGSPVSVQVVAPSDAARDAASLTYSYDFDNDGAFEVVGSTQASATVPGSYLAAAARTCWTAARGTTWSWRGTCRR